MSKQKPKEKIQPYNSVADMVRDLNENDEETERFEQHLQQRRVVHALFAERSSAGVSQAEMAERMNCSQSRISKLENGEDDDLRLGDLREYLSALNRDLSIVIAEKSPTTVGQIKYHAFMIQALLEKLRTLANGDDRLEEGVTEFHWEALLNMVRLIVDGAMELPSFPSKLPSVISSMVPPPDMGDDVQDSDPKTAEPGLC